MGLDKSTDTEDEGEDTEHQHEQVTHTHQEGVHSPADTFNSLYLQDGKRPNL